jgi:hypothetical protein
MNDNMMSAMLAEAIEWAIASARKRGGCDEEIVALLADALLVAYAKVCPVGENLGSTDRTGPLR